MIMACGAESRIVTKYAGYVEEAKKHASAASPLISLQFGMIVSQPQFSLMLQKLIEQNSSLVPLDPSGSHSGMVSNVTWRARSIMSAL